MNTAERRRKIGELRAERLRLAGFDRLTSTQEARQADVETELYTLEREDLADRVRSGGVDLLPGDGSDSGDRQHRSGERGRALGVLERTERSAGHLSRSQLDSIAHMVEKDETDLAARWLNVAGDDDYLRAFHKIMRNPEMGQFEWNDAERAAFSRAQAFQRSGMAGGTGSLGGYMVPFQLDPAVILTNAGTSNTNLRSVFTVKTIVSDTWHGVTSAGVSSHWRGEGLEADDDSPTLAQPMIRTHRGDSFVPFSYEVGMDVPHFAEEVSKLLTDSAAMLQASAFIHGTGNGEPMGIVPAAAAVTGCVVPTGAVGTYAVDDVYAVKRALPARWRNDAGWLGNEDTYDLTRQFATGTGQQSGAFWADLGEATPPKLLGRPVTESSQMDSAVATGSNLLVYGDLDEYYVVDRVGTTIELIPHLQSANGRPLGQRGFFLYFRCGGDLVVPDAVRVLQVK